MIIINWLKIKLKINFTNLRTSFPHFLQVSHHTRTSAGSRRTTSSWLLSTTSKPAPRMPLPAPNGFPTKTNKVSSAKWNSFETTSTAAQWCSRWTPTIHVPRAIPMMAASQLTIQNFLLCKKLTQFYSVKFLNDEQKTEIQRNSLPKY